MSARVKSTLIISAILIVVLPILMFVSGRVIMLGFRELETMNARSHILQAVDAFNTEIEDLNGKAKIWATSDDAYNFLAGQNPEFLAEILFPQTIQNLRTNLIAFVDHSNKVIALRSFDYITGLNAPVTDAQRAELENSPLITSLHAKDHLSGIHSFNNQLMLLVCLPVTPNNPAALSNGHLIFGRYLNQEEIKRLADMTNLLLEVRPVNAPDLPPDFQAVRENLAHEQVIVTPLDTKTVVAYHLISDLRGSPALILRIQLLREVYLRGKTTLTTFILAMALLGIVFGFAGQTMLEKVFTSQKSSLETMGRYQAVVEQIAEGMIQVDGEKKTILQANPAINALLGYSPGELIGTSLHTVTTREIDEMERDFQTVIEGGQTITGERQFRRKDGNLVDVEVSAARIDHGKNGEICLVVRDITSRKQVEKAMRESEERYYLATRGANDGLWDWDLSTDTVYYSSRWKSMLGYDESEIGNQAEDWYKLVHPDDLPSLKTQIDLHLQNITGHFQNEHRLLHRDGSYRWVLSRGLAVWNAEGKPYRMSGSLTDISERKQSEEQFRHDALHDALTGLPNRTLFMDRLGQAIERSRRRSDYLFALLFLDFDRFKVINDSLGHTIGDQLLIAGARRLETCLRTMDTIARLGGDEFVILVEYIDSPRDAIRVAERVQEAIKPAFLLNGHEIFISVSIGIVLSNIGYEHADDALRDADIAMYRSKALGRARYELFNPDLRSHAMARLELETDLRHAIEHSEFLLHYQPILSLSSEKITGFEALLRWQHPERGLISPADFIPVAEETGLIIPIGIWVIEEACRQMKFWQEQNLANRNLTISVNMSGKQFQQPDLPQEIDRILAATGLDIACLRLEITESVVMEAVESTAQVLRQLKTMGLQLEIDDFGTGYSSLSYLQQLPIDAIKIDRTFIHQMRVNNNDQGIVQAIVAMAHNLGMRVIAEGVELGEQLVRLKEMQCELAQGYLFHRPMQEEDVARLLASLNKSVAE